MIFKIRFIGYSILLAIIGIFVGVFAFKKSNVSLPQVVEPPIKLSVCGWMPWWDYNDSVKELSGNPNLFDTISPFIYVLGESGTITKKKDISKNEIPTIPTIYNDFDGERVSRIINSKILSQRHINDLVSLVKEGNFEGIEIDYEYLKEEDKDAFSSFIELLGDELHKERRLLFVTLVPKTKDEAVWESASAQDWEKIGHVADIVRLMTYDLHWSESEAGPIASLPWVKDVISYARAKISVLKIVLGIGIYGYDWEEGETQASELTLSEADELSKKLEAEIVIDKETNSSYFNYKENGKNHVVWFETWETIKDKINEAKKARLSGICFWRMGGVPQKLYNEIFEEVKK